MQLRSWALAPEVVVTKATRKRDGEFRRGAPRVKPRHSFRVFGTTVKPALNLPGGRTLPLTLPSEIGLVGNWEMYFHSFGNTFSGNGSRRYRCNGRKGN
jgi:hypothetical protein